jgi:hypothetical protein
MRMLSWESGSAPAIPVLTSFLHHINEIGIRITLFCRGKMRFVPIFPIIPIFLPQHIRSKLPAQLWRPRTQLRSFC